MRHARPSAKPQTFRGRCRHGWGDRGRRRVGRGMSSCRACVGNGLVPAHSCVVVGLLADHARIVPMRPAACLRRVRAASVRSLAIDAFRTIVGPRRVARRGWELVATIMATARARRGGLPPRRRRCGVAAGTAARAEGVSPERRGAGAYAPPPSPAPPSSVFPSGSSRQRTATPRRRQAASRRRPSTRAKRSSRSISQG